MLTTAQISSHSNFFRLYFFQTRDKIIPMSELIVSVSGMGQYALELSLVDAGAEDETVEVWRGIFIEREGDSQWEVYFEMGSEYEIWDLVQMAIESYRASIDEVD